MDYFLQHPCRLHWPCFTHRPLHRPGAGESGKPFKVRLKRLRDSLLPPLEIDALFINLGVGLMLLMQVFWAVSSLLISIGHRRFSRLSSEATARETPAVRRSHAHEMKHRKRIMGPFHVSTFWYRLLAARRPSPSHPVVRCATTTPA